MILVDMENPIRCGVCRFPKAGICNKSAMPDMSGKNKCPIIAEIPDNATNGDVIKALFPNAKSKRNLASDILYFGRSQTMMRYTNEWWNAPYKSESEVENE